MGSHLIRTLFLIAAVGVCCIAASANAQGYSAIGNARMLKLQERVDELYERGKYDLAFLIYRDELAAAGDKYAQYMVGYMTLQGKGAKQNAVVASAWYRLAAERGTREFVMVRDELMEDLDAVETAQSDQIFLELRQDYSDIAVLADLVSGDLGTLEEATGSRVRAGGASSMTVIDNRSGTYRSGASYYRNVKTRLEDRLKLLGKLLGDENFETDPDRVNIDEIDREVSLALDAID